MRVVLSPPNHTPLCPYTCLPQSNPPPRPYIACSRCLPKGVNDRGSIRTGVTREQIFRLGNSGGADRAERHSHRCGHGQADTAGGRRCDCGERAVFQFAGSRQFCISSAITLFSLLGALQFAPRIRGKIIRPGTAGPAAWLCRAGIIAALSGLWLAHFYLLPPTDGTALYVTRLVVGVWMTFALCRGYFAIRARDIASHRNWMLRGYAIGMGAGTQVLTNLPVILTVGPPDTAVRAVLMGAGWVINAIIAEAVIHRRGRAAVLARA